jgi:tetratricopeptide (TPR) repeat protein
LQPEDIQSITGAGRAEKQYISNEGCMITSFVPMKHSTDVFMDKALRRSISAAVLVIMVMLLVGTTSAQDYLDYYERGEFALRVEKWDSAIDFFSKSIADNPSFFVAYHNRAIAYSKKGEYDKSIADLKKAVQLNPDYPDAYGLMGLLYEIKKNYASALEAYKEASSREKRPAAKKLLQKYIQDMEAKIKKPAGN